MRREGDNKGVENLRMCEGFRFKALNGVRTKRSLRLHYAIFL